MGLVMTNTRGEGEGGGEYRPAITSAALLYEVAIAEEDRVLGLVSLDARGVH